MEPAHAGQSGSDSPGGQHMRTRIKICGITRPGDALAAANAGADAIGLVFYPPSPRFVSVERAIEVRDALPVLVQTVALFVNPAASEVDEVIARVKPSLLQFHGDETPAFCKSFDVPWVKACRMKQGVDLLEYFRSYRGAAGWLADAFVDGYGGAGQTFDWSLVPPRRDKALILSGGLTKDNVGEAIRAVRPWAVDVSSGVESGKGIKDAAKIAAFIQEVHHADV
jgi:phosphoribosylanthranilate isomerase